MRLHGVIVLTLLLVFFSLSFSSALRESLTFDERTDVEVGLKALWQKNFSVEPYNPPFIRMLVSWPLAIGMDTRITSSVLAMRWLPARSMNILLGIGILLVTFFLAQKNFGRGVALWSLFFLTFEPTFLAHSHYITHDVGYTLFFLIAYATFLKVVELSSLSNQMLFGVTLGLSFASKITSIPYFFVSAGIVLFAQKRGSILISIKSSLWPVTRILLICAFTIWATYFFQAGIVIKPLDRPGRVSNQLKNLAVKSQVPLLSESIIFLETQQLPLGDYLAILKNNALRFRLPTHNFFFGTYFQATLWYFLPINFFLKTPLPLLFLFFYFLAKKKSIDRTIFVFFCLPIVGILITAALLRINPYVRYLLPLYPLLAIVGGYTVVNFLKGERRGFWLLCIYLWTVIGTLASFPHFISYANELAGSKEKRYQVFYDSNIDWGQSLPDLSLFIQKKKPRSVRYSYFGRDYPEDYGLASTVPYNSDTIEGMCSFYLVNFPGGGSENITAISISNWYHCRYFETDELKRSKIKEVIGESFLIF